jgi:8-oxo-dGTP diphosphatase
MVGDMITTVEYDYPTFHLSMDCFWAEVVSGELVLKEAEAARWLTKEDLWQVDWLPADEIVVKEIEKAFGEEQ